jgi:hypothetical protein
MVYLKTVGRVTTAHISFTVLYEGCTPVTIAFQYLFPYLEPRVLIVAVTVSYYAYRAVRPTFDKGFNLLHSNLEILVSTSCLMDVAIWETYIANC